MTLTILDILAVVYLSGFMPATYRGLEALIDSEVDRNPWLVCGALLIVPFWPILLPVAVVNTAQGKA